MQLKNRVWTVEGREEHLGAGWGQPLGNNDISAAFTQGTDLQSWDCRTCQDLWSMALS